MAGVMLALTALSGWTWPVWAQDADPPWTLADQRALQQVLTTHCAACHDAANDKTDGGFGLATDLPALAASRRYVMPGEVEASSLWWVIDSGEMPPLDVVDAPLPQEAVDLVRRWITDGAVVLEDPDAQENEQDVENAQATPDAPQLIELGDADVLVDTDASDAMPEPEVELAELSRWALRWHATMTHLPIGMVLGAVLAEALRLLARRTAFEGVTRFCVWVGAVTLVPAVASGWLGADVMTQATQPRGMVAWHRWSGVVLLGLAWWCVLMCEWRLLRRATAATAGLRVGLLLVLVTLVGNVGFAVMLGT